MELVVLNNEAASICVPYLKLKIMAMPRKRPLVDPEQPYVYVWRLRGEVLYVGSGKNNRCRPGCKASWSGRCKELKELLITERHNIEVELTPFNGKEKARYRERELIVLLKPKYNIAPGCGGYSGMHTAKGLANISKGVKAHKWSDERRAVQAVRMKGNTIRKEYNARIERTKCK